jgi:hypothetical protein
MKQEGGENRMLHITKLCASPTCSNGHRVTAKVQRAFEAADAYRDPTIRHLAALAGISPSYVKAALKVDFTTRLQILNGNEPLVPNGNRKLDAESLTARYRRASQAEKLETATEIGVDVIFDEMLNPLLA